MKSRQTREIRRVPPHTRDSGSNGNLAQFDFNDSNGFLSIRVVPRGPPPTKPPSSNPTGTCPFPKTKPSSSTSTRPILMATPSLILYHTETITSFSTPTHPPQSSLSLPPKDFESPEDNDSNNRYEATIQVSDGNTSVSLNLFVHVTDAVESGPNQAPAFQSTETCPFLKTKPSSLTSTRLTRRRHPHLLSPIRRRPSPLTPTHPPESSLSRPRISSHPRITTRTTATRPRSRSQTETPVSLNLFVHVTDAENSSDYRGVDISA